MKYAADRDLEMAKDKTSRRWKSTTTTPLEAQQELTEATLRADKAKNFRPTLQNVETEVQLPQTHARPQTTAPIRIRKLGIA